MPRIGSRVVSDAGLNLIFDWIKQMPERKASNEPNPADAVAVERSNVNLLDQLRASAVPSPAARTELIDRLLGSTVGALAALREINTHSFKPDLRTEVIARGTASANALVRDLFERFVPEDRRVKRLGADIQPDQILALKGEAARGEKVFFAEGGAQCFQCHRIRSQGRDFGPDLSRIGQKYSRTQLLDNLLNPSKIIEPAFATFQVEAKSDLSYAGLLVRKSAEEVVLKDANLNEVHVKLTDVKTMEASKVSAMPEGLLQTLTAQEAADLLDFLGSLR
jgi:putative heme-binding domain-containing protein